MRVGIVVGEASGDLLGAALIEELKKYDPTLVFEGVLGPRLKSLGGRALYSAERLAIMGFIEPLKRLPELLRMRRRLISYFCHNPPDVFIGIDAPDFTLGIEKKLKKHGIKTVHYVSPSVWAWRQGRIKTIKKAVDLMLVLFPFEVDFYQQYGVPVLYVGHPMAREIKLVDKLPSTVLTQIAILPGSRHSEISHIAPVFLETALKLKEAFPEVEFLSPMASPSIREHFLKIKAKIAPDLNIKLFDGNADAVLASSDVALIASGTATLQAMLHQCPMVVGFKTSAFNAWLIRRLYKHTFFSLPNILLNQSMVREFFQENATATTLYLSIKLLLDNPLLCQTMRHAFARMHEELREPATSVAARGILDSVAQKFSKYPP